MTVSPATTLAALCRSRFDYFTWKAFNETHREVTFQHAWHVSAICEALDEACFGTERRLVITVPPRHLKSFSAAVALPAFILGIQPAAKIMVVTYSLDLGREHAADCRRLMETPWYQGLFPTRLGRCSSEHLRTISGGDRMTASVGGSVTGFAADFIIIDDALKAADASSPAERQRVHDFIDGTLLTRFNRPSMGTVIAIQQRLHEDDPAGYLLAKGGYTHLNLPAIATERQVIAIGGGRTHVREPGTPLFPQHFDLAVLEQLRRELGAPMFQLQYQQDPVSAGGTCLRWERFKIYSEQLPRSRYLYLAQCWDTAYSTGPDSSWSVCTTWGWHDGVWHLLDVLRERLEYPELVRKVRRMKEDWSADHVLIEEAASGRTLLQDLFREDRAVYRALEPDADKELRFNAALTWVDDGKVALPRDAPWLQEFKRELIGFPRTRHDDQVDSFAHFLIWAKTNQSRRYVGAAAERKSYRGG